MHLELQRRSTICGETACGLRKCTVKPGCLALGLSGGDGDAKLCDRIVMPPPAHLNTRPTLSTLGAV